MSKKTRTIKVDALARVEGEGALTVRIKNDVIEDVKFRIFEPPRFFEALLQGRMYSDAPDITARICGICPIAYMMGASQAMEDALGVTVTGPLRDLRRMIYCGEWIESHVLHAYLLHAPDFLGFEDAIRLSQHHPGVVEKALQLKKLGNRILEVIGGRAVHPVNLRVGGFYRAPRKKEIRALIESLQWAVEASLDTVKLFAGFDFPDYHYDYTCVSLRHPDEYPITEGRLVSNCGLDIPIHEFPTQVTEQHVAHSNALQGVLSGSDSYLVGPIARYNNNFHQLSDLAKQAASEAGLGPVCDNPFQSIVVRAVETLYACEEALRLAQAYEEPDAACVELTVRAGEGHGCTEAPRGICYHRYRLDEEGCILEATIIPPTSQNQQQIERDLFGVVEKNLDLPEDKLKWRCEQTIRNYDPCISCATHFLKLTLERE
ncbi:MAG: Ni/Fe hydrogenase subunit alpha [Candidatus Competibacteraceae bacterium]|jgi:coenzyme F420-reducing hydrogenase alpha subunit|nr:Ni/Fe hydrogenase subunit alpha [Candidatus Competibacteraceae bacterium]